MSKQRRPTSAVPSAVPSPTSSVKPSDQQNSDRRHIPRLRNNTEGRPKHPASGGFEEYPLPGVGVAFYGEGGLVRPTDRYGRVIR